MQFVRSLGFPLVLVLVLFLWVQVRLSQRRDFYQQQERSFQDLTSFRTLPIQTCSPTEGACTFSFEAKAPAGGIQLYQGEVQIFPKIILHDREFIVVLKFCSQSLSEKMVKPNCSREELRDSEVQIFGKSMSMGESRLGLKFEEGQWRAVGKLASCSEDKMIWSLNLRLKLKDSTFVIPFQIQSHKAGT